MEEGLTQGDSVGYYAIAKNWSQGDLTDFWQDAFYRPVVYGVDAVALLLFGDNDYSIKIMHGIFDLASIALIVLIGIELGVGVLPGIAAGAVVAFLPYTIYWCRAAMPHGLTACFVLAAVYCILRGSRPAVGRRAGLLWDMLAGLNLSLAANTHADVGLLGPGFLLVQLMRDRPFRLSWRKVWSACAFGAGVILVYLAGFAVFGPAKVMLVISNEFAMGVQQPYIEQAPLYRVPFDILAISSAHSFENRWWIPVFILTATLACLMLAAIPSARPRLKTAIPLILLFSYILFFPLTIGPFDKSHARLFVALLPIAMLAVTCPVYDLLRQTLPRMASVPVFLVAAAAVFAAIPNEAFRSVVSQRSSYVIASREDGRDPFAAVVSQRSSYVIASPFRALYEAIGDRVTANHKLLIVPSNAYYNEGFQTGLYFGETAEFLADQPRREAYTPELFERTIRDGNFSYFYRPVFTDSRILDPVRRYGWRTFAWIRHLGRPGYTKEDESRIIESTFAKLGARRIIRMPGGDVYSLRKRSIFPNSDFEMGTLENWSSPSLSTPFTVVEDKDTGASVAPLTLATPQILRTPAIMTGQPKSHPFYLESSSYSHGNRDESRSGVGELLSLAFTIEFNVIAFEISDSSNSSLTHVALRVDNTEYRAVSPGPGLTALQWDLSTHLGRTAQLVVRDLDPTPGHSLRVNGFYYVY